MSQKPSVKLERESKYKLIIQGKISDSWNDQFGPLKVTQEITNKGGYKTTLIFSAKDQAELMSVLSTITQMRAPILSLVQVEYKEDI
jgi:hypothetical protein